METQLKELLLTGNPMLFVGAGFSYGSSNASGELPTGDRLRQDILSKFIIGHFEEKDKEEIEKYSLQELCQFIYDEMEKKDELQEYIVSRFKNTKPQPFHLLLNEYPWKKNIFCKCR